MVRMKQEQFEVELDTGSPADLKAGDKTVIVIRYDGEPWGGDNGKHGCEVLRVFETDQAYSVWVKTFLGQNLKIRFPKEEGQNATAEATEPVTSGDPVERAVAEASEHELPEEMMGPLRDRIGALRRNESRDETSLKSTGEQEEQAKPPATTKLRLIRGEGGQKK